MLRVFIVCTAILLAVFNQNITANQLQPIETGVSVNQKVPEIMAVDSQENPQKLAQLSGSKGLVLVFFRSADWCPYCKKHLAEINQWNDKLSGLGYEVAAISYDSPQILATFKQSEQIKFKLLADKESRTMQAFKVLNTDYQPGSRHYGIPFPGIMIINPDGTLAHKYFYQGYKMRVKPDALYQWLKEKSSSKSS
ncbi:peroxiredoxin family protein [Aliikangiella coralliicola]|uniref:Peroxiredoxin family protein n=1 Tax=Aliikangiella coralliicola TaxID=2592383 RepID=A0A545UG40_9GAMM|nr:peroxiredoxin family protein [Aliikangiella coralliicola]TQV88438.1 peroxiredoxin family protein [Aliikangiella coralliicola]